MWIYSSKELTSDPNPLAFRLNLDLVDRAQQIDGVENFESRSSWEILQIRWLALLLLIILSLKSVEDCSWLGREGGRKSNTGVHVPLCLCREITNRGSGVVLRYWIDFLPGHLMLFVYLCRWISLLSPMHCHLYNCCQRIEHRCQVSKIWIIASSGTISHPSFTSSKDLHSNGKARLRVYLCKKTSTVFRKRGPPSGFLPALFDTFLMLVKRGERDRVFIGVEFLNPSAMNLYIIVQLAVEWFSVWGDG